MANIFNRPWSHNRTILSLYAFFFFFALVGLRFESPLLNYSVVAFLLTTPIYLFYILLFHFKASTTVQKVLKVISLIFVAIGASICTLFLLFDLLATAFIIYDGDVDRGKIEIARVTISSHTNVVAYQTNYGATTDFGTVVYKETQLFRGLKIIKSIGDAYHTNDIKLEMVGAKIIVKDLTFTSPTHKQEYYNEGGALRVGMELEM